MAVTYCEFDGSPRESFGPDEFRAEVKLLCAYSDRYSLVEELMYSAYPRLAYPCYCWNCSIEGYGKCTASNGNTGLAAYDYAVVNATFSTKNPSVEDLYVEEFVPTIDYLKLPCSGLYWDTTDKPPLQPDECPGIPQPGGVYRLTRYMLSSVPAFATDLQGCVNLAAFSPATPGWNLTFAAQTLLFNPPKINRAFKSDGSYVFTVSTELIWKPNRCPVHNVDRGWNWFFHPRSNQFVQILACTGWTMTGEGESYSDTPTYEPFLVYPTGDFSALWS